MKRILVLLLSITVVLSLSGCDLLNGDDITPDDIIDCQLNPDHEECVEVLNCIPGTYQVGDACVDIITQEDCRVDEMVVDNACVINPDYVAPEFPVLPGPDYSSQGYEEYLGRDITNSECEHLDNIGEWQPVWCDEFEYVGLPSSSLWNYDVGGGGWGNAELQYYTNADIDNAYVANGYLTIEAFQESIGGRDYSSARLITKNKGDWTYGKIQIRAKVPGGKGTWPAAWMLPTDWEYGGWPDSGEIDIMEYVGYDQNTLHATIHTGAFNHSIGTQVGKARTIQNMETEFHVFEMEWEPNVIRFYINGYNFYTVSYDPDSSANVEPWEAWPFDKDFHLLLNLAFGGNWGGATGIDATLDNMKYEIDYVRVYQKDYAGMDTEAPSAVTNLRVISENPSKVFVGWDVATDDVMVEYYEVYVNDVLLENSTHNAVNILPSSEADVVVKVIPVDFAGNKGLEQTLTVAAPQAPTTADRIEAESFVAMSGVQTEDTQDSTGVLNVGYIDNGDYMSYVIEVTEAGQYQMKARIASQSNGASFNLLQDNSLIATLTSSATGGWQTWTDAYSSTFNLEVGTYTFKIQATGDGWNINYFDFVKTN